MINAKKFTLKSIVEGPFFQTYIPRSWQKPAISKGKIHTCASICGKLPEGIEYIEK